MSTLGPSLNFTLSNDAWRNAVQFFDQDWDARIVSVEEPLNDNPRGAALAAEIDYFIKGPIHLKPELIKYRAGKKWELRAKTVSFYRALKVAEVWCKRFAAVCKTWDQRSHTVELAWKHQGMLLGFVLERDHCPAFDKESSLAMLALVKDHSQAVDGAKKSRDESLTIMKDSFQGLEALIYYKNKNTGNFEKTRDEVLDDFEKTRDEVLDVIRKANKVISYDALCKAQDNICYNVQKFRADAAYCAAAIKVEDEATADFQKFFDELGVTLQKTQDMAIAFFEKIHNKVVASLPRAEKEPVTGNKMSESTASCQKTCDEVIDTHKNHYSDLDAFKKSQYEVIAHFKKFRDLSINIKKAINAASTSALKSPNKSTVEATVYALIEKIENEATDAGQARDELIAALKKDDKAVALLMKSQDEDLVAIQYLQRKDEEFASLPNFQDQVELFASFLKVKDEDFALILEEHIEALASRMKVQDEAFTSFLHGQAKVLASLMRVQDENLAKKKLKQDKDKFLTSLKNQDEDFADLHENFKIRVNLLALS